MFGHPVLCRTGAFLVVLACLSPNLITVSVADVSIREMQRRSLVAYETSLSAWAKKVEQTLPLWRELEKEGAEIAALELELTRIALVAGQDAKVRAQESNRKAALRKLVAAELRLHKAVARAKEMAAAGQSTSLREAAIEAQKILGEMTDASIEAEAAQLAVKRLIANSNSWVEKSGGTETVQSQLNATSSTLATRVPAWEKRLRESADDWRSLTRLQSELRTLDQGLAQFSDTLKRSRDNASGARDRALLDGYLERAQTAIRRKEELKKACGRLRTQFNHDQARQSLDERQGPLGAFTVGAPLIDQARALLTPGRVAAGDTALRDAEYRLKLALRAVAGIPSTVATASGMSTPASSGPAVGLAPGGSGITPTGSGAPGASSPSAGSASTDTYGGMVISPQIRKIGVGETRKLLARDHGGKAITGVEWVSSNTMSLTVSPSGGIAGHKIGEAIILAKAGDLRAWLDVEVVAGADAGDANGADSGEWGDSGWEDATDTLSAPDGPSSNAGWGDSGWEDEEIATTPPPPADSPPASLPRDKEDNLDGDWIYAWRAIQYGDIKAGTRRLSLLDQYAERCGRLHYPEHIPFQQRNSAVNTARNCMLKQLELADTRGVPADLVKGVIRLQASGTGYSGTALAADSQSDYGYIHQNTMLNAVRNITPGTSLMKLKALGNGRYSGQCLVARVFDSPPDRWTRCEVQVVASGRAILSLYWRPDLYWGVGGDQKSAWSRLGNAAPPMRFAALIRIRGGLGPPPAAPASSSGSAPTGARRGNCWVGCRPGGSPLKCAVACDGQFSATTALANGGHTVYKLKNASWEQCAEKMRELAQLGW